MNDVDPAAIATEFLHCVARGDVEAAWAHVAPGFRHHNVHVAADGEALKRAMADNARRFPGKTLTVRRVLCDGEQVMTLSEVRHSAGDPGFVVAHVFRFEGGKIAELWDVAQALPEPPVNANAPF
jgi:predicted SnoaL-like aldol condensation-catalyzing enzyme